MFIPTVRRVSVCNIWNARPPFAVPFTCPIKLLPVPEVPHCILELPWLHSSHDYYCMWIVSSCCTGENVRKKRRVVGWVVFFLVGKWPMFCEEFKQNCVAHEYNNGILGAGSWGWSNQTGIQAPGFASEPIGWVTVIVAGGGKGSRAGFSAWRENLKRLGCLSPACFGLSPLF